MSHHYNTVAGRVVAHTTPLDKYPSGTFDYVDHALALGVGKRGTYCSFDGFEYELVHKAERRASGQSIGRTHASGRATSIDMLDHDPMYDDPQR